MIKYYCDKCGVEIDRENQFEHKELKISKHVVTLTMVDSNVEADALCLYCVIDEVNKLDSRSTGFLTE